MCVYIYRERERERERERVCVQDLGFGVQGDMVYTSGPKGLPWFHFRTQVSNI